MRFLRILWAAIVGFVNDDCFLKASALTYYTLFSIVPVLAVLFGIAKGFGIEDLLLSNLKTVLSDHPEITNRLIEFIDSTLRHARGSVVAGFGIILLLWSVILLFGTIENTFNTIWKVPVSRNFLAMMRDYPPIILFAPLFFAFISSISIYLLNDIVGYAENFGFETMLSGLQKVWIQATTFILSWIFFTFLYLFLPSAKVRLNHGMIAGLIAAVLFYILQHTFIAFQVYLTSYSALYGSFAALPLFLLWIQAIWWIVFLGAEVAYQFQHGTYRFKTRKEKFSIPYPAVAVLLLQEASARFKEKRRPLSPEEFSNRHQLSHSIAAALFAQLEDAGIIVRIVQDDDGKTYFQPAAPLEHTLVAEMLQAIAPVLANEVELLESEHALLAESYWEKAFAKAEKVPLL